MDAGPPFEAVLPQKAGMALKSPKMNASFAVLDSIMTLPEFSDMELALDAELNR